LVVVQQKNSVTASQHLCLGQVDKTDH